MSDATLMTDAATNTEGASASDNSASNASTTAANTSAAAGDTTQAQNQQTQGDQGTSTQQSDADGKTDSDGNAAKDGDEGSAKQGAPESYEDFKIPDGVQVDPVVLDDLKAQAKELNLTQEQAQKLADYAAQRSQTIKAMQTEALQKAMSDWGESSKADKEFGGEQLSENLSVAKKALDTFGTPELRALLNESGLGNHPEIIRAFYRAGKAISEDRFVPSGSSAPKGDRDPAKSLYPNQQN